MKKALLIAAAVMFVAGSAFAVLPPVGYIGLFKDLTHSVDPAANTISCPMGMYTMFHGYLWILPSVNGAVAVQYKVVLPAGVSQLSKTKSIIVSDVVLGDEAAGISVTFTGCQMDWAWVYDYTYLALIPQVQTKIDLVPDPIVLPPRFLFSTCDPGPPANPVEECIYLTPLYLCWTPDPGVIGVQETNWGAIKSLF